MTRITNEEYLAAKKICDAWTAQFWADLSERVEEKRRRGEIHDWTKDEMPKLAAALLEVMALPKEGVL